LAGLGDFFISGVEIPGYDTVCLWGLSGAPISTDCFPLHISDVLSYFELKPECANRAQATEFII